MSLTIDCGEGKHDICSGSGTDAYLIPQLAGERFNCGCRCHHNGRGVPCPSYRGGEVSVPCPRCEGRGHDSYRDPNGESNPRLCPTCGGSGVESCVFCDYDDENRTIDEEEHVDIGESFLSIWPLNPVTKGHLLVVPRRHVADASEDPDLAARAFQIAAQWASTHEAANIITSKGVAATQTVFHLHIHVVPRRPADGLKLPWSPKMTPARMEREGF